MDPREVEKLRVAYNEEHPDEAPIRKSQHVWQDITERMREECRTAQRACITHALVKKPAAPESWAANGGEWLSSDDIDRCQQYYQDIVPDYYYVKSVPIDFDKHSQTGKCLVSSLCTLKISELYKKGYRRIGLVFNTDTSEGPGEHWIAAFADLRENPTMTYFDSYARKPEKEIIELMNRWKQQVDEMGEHDDTPMQLYFNKVRHQYKDAQCGMYCIYFLYCCLFDVPMNKTIPDDVIMMMRPLFFRYKQHRSKK
jgi:hypothetical protein